MTLLSACAHDGVGGIEPARRRAECRRARAHPAPPPRSTPLIPAPTRFAAPLPASSALSVRAASAQTQLNPQTLSFQDFSASGGQCQASAAANSGAIGSSMLKPQQMSGAGLADESGQGGNTGGGSGGFWTLKYYQPLFDVDTVQVLSRIKGSLLPRPRGAFFELISANPDLYGPFWIATTLIFAMAMTGNLASYIAWYNHVSAEGEAKVPWTYDVNQLTLAGCVVYSYVTLLPLLLWLLLRYYGTSRLLTATAQ